MVTETWKLTKFFVIWVFAALIWLILCLAYVVPVSVLYMLGVRGNVGTVVSTTTEIVGLVTNKVRISIVDFLHEPCFRFDIFGCEPEWLCDPECENGGWCVYENTCACPPPFYGPGCKNTHLPPGSGCLQPLGMWDGRIKDSQLVATSSSDDKNKEKARYLCCLGEENGAWCPSPDDHAPYYEVHLDKPYLIAMFMFQPPSKLNFWEVPSSYMNTFTLQYRNIYLDVMETFAVKIGAIHNSTVSYTPTLDPFLLTDVIRIVPDQWTNNACFRFEIIGCDPDQGPDPLLQPTTKAPIITQAPVTTKATVTTKAPITTKAPVTTKAPTTTDNVFINPGVVVGRKRRSFPFPPKVNNSP